MADQQKRKLKLATTVYWILLLYIIAALVWWFLSLEKQNETLYRLRMEHLMARTDQGTAAWQQQRQQVEEQRRVNVAKYVGEGGTFLVLILVGAVFVYRSVRRQFRMHRQQQNFVMAITHELKTPIAVSRLNLETLQKHQLDEAKTKRLLQMTLQENLRLDTLINNILLSAQLEEHSYHINREPVDFTELCCLSAQQFRQRYPDRLLETEIEKGVHIQGDPLLLKLLLSNLLENANKYSPRDKPIRLLLRQGHAIELQVTDEGPGIAPEERKHVFEKFYRVGNEQTRRTKGTGLGLFISRKIVQDHGGSIAITDNQPQGSNFMIHFPQ
jgi:two-component system sensor histidine kinase CiaH